VSINSIGELLRAFVLADATVSGLVVTRMYPLRLPQNVTMPALTYQRISGVRIGQLNGVASAADPRYQIDAWAANVAGALALGKAVRQRLENYTGTWTDGASPATTAFVQVRFDSERDLFEEDILGGLCRHSADYFIFHSTNSGAL
jgi:hypothetical protein